MDPEIIVIFIFYIFQFAHATPTPAPALTRRAKKPLEVPPCDYKWMTQKLDHQPSCNDTWQQRYSFFDEFFKPGGPILFYQGEEVPYLECGNDTILYEWAKELNGLVVSLEHRYFGASKPFGNDSSKVENLKYLTLDNVMDDAVEFLDQVKKNVTGAEESKVVMMAGSYGGFLAGAYRLNRPEAIYASIAAAGPTRGFGNSSDPEMYSWWKWTNRVYQDKSIVASQNIKNAFEKLMTQIASNQTSSLQSTFNLCSPPEPETLPYLPVTIAATFSFAAEFNYHKPRPVSALSYPLEKVIEIAEAENDPLQILNSTVWMYFESVGETCMELGPDIVQILVPYIENPYFSYTTCTYCPFNSQAYIGNGTIFPNIESGDGIAQGCKQQFGVTTLTPDEINERYHFSQEEIQNSTRIIWSLAEYDPTSSLEPAHLPLTEDRMRSRVLYANDVAHMEDTFRTDPGDRAGVTWLRKREFEIIKGWLEPVEVF